MINLPNKTILNSFAIFFIQMVIGISSYSQSSFQILFESQIQKVSTYIYEDVSGNFLVVGAEENAGNGRSRNKIWKISPYGDTSSYTIDLGFKQSTFNLIERNSDSTFLIIGCPGIHRIAQRGSAGDR
jgi:hypothetical protein